MSSKNVCVRVVLATGVLFTMAQGCARPPEQQQAAVAPVAQAGCKADDECKAAPGGAFCVNGACVACRDDATCGAGQACKDGVCTAAVVQNVSREMAIPEQCNSAAKPVRFAFDSSELTAEAKTVLDEQAECLKARQTVQLVLEGHCDDRGTEEYNLALGDRRAATVRTYLAHLGVPTDGIRTLSKGKNEPMCSEATDQCWAMNRRVEWK